MKRKLPPTALPGFAMSASLSRLPVFQSVGEPINLVSTTVGEQLRTQLISGVNRE